MTLDKIIFNVKAPIKLRMKFSKTIFDVKTPLDSKINKLALRATDRFDYKTREQ